MAATEAPSLNPALRDFWRTPSRVKVLYGGRASSKSWDAAGVAILMAHNYSMKFLCTRQFQNKIEESVYALLKVQIYRFGLEWDFDILDNKIRCRSTGSEFVFYGLWRSIDQIKGLEDVDVHWCEEAHLLSKEQWDILRPTIRKQGAEHWIIFNPQFATDFIYKEFVLKKSPSVLLRHIDYDENPFLSQTMRDDIEEMKAADYEEFLHIYKGVPRQDSELAIIRRSWIMACIDGHKKLGFEPSGMRRVGFDIADAGKDACATVFAHGPLNCDADLWKAKPDELFKSCGRAWDFARDRGAELITFDSVGMGAFAGEKLEEIGRKNGKNIQHKGFHAGGAVAKPDKIYRDTHTKNRDYFKSNKPQAWWGVSDRFQETYNAITSGRELPEDRAIFISSEMPHLGQLVDELSIVLRVMGDDGKVNVEGKEMLKKRGIPSPNLADAFIMANLPGDMLPTSFFDSFFE